MSLYAMVAPDASYHSTKFQPYTPSQSKILPTSREFHLHLPVVLKHTPGNSYIGYHKDTP